MTDIFDFYRDPKKHDELKAILSLSALSDVADIAMGQSPKGDTYNSEEGEIPLVNGPVEFGSHHPEKVKWTLEAKRFSDLGFTGRKHLQEWLENSPQALAQGNGEELLIIQKEFDGFEPFRAALGQGRERLDLLAIDKDGNLVIIENKLDDSGRDVM